MKKRKITPILEAVLIVLVIIMGLAIFNNLAITGNATFTKEKSDIEISRINLGKLQTANTELFKTMGWEIDPVAISSLEQRITQIEEGNEQETIQREKVDLAYEEWENIVGGLPKTIIIEKQFSDSFIAEPNEIKPFIDERDITSAYFYQSNFSITTRITVYNIELYSGVKKQITLLQNTIKPIVPINQEVQVLQIIPQLAKQNIKIGNPGYTEKQGAYLYNFASLNNEITLSYGLQNIAITPLEIFDYKTIILPKPDEGESLPEFVGETIEEEYVCGDGICLEPFETEATCPSDCGNKKRNIPWVFIAIAAGIIIAGALYFNAYKGRGDIREITKGKSPFKNQEDLKNVKEFIKKQINTGENKADITKKLYDQKWTKAQIVYAFEEVEWEMRKVFVDQAPNRTVNLEPLVLYVKKSLLLKMDPILIKTKLLEKGWKPSQIEDAFVRAKKEAFGK